MADARADASVSKRVGKSDATAGRASVPSEERITRAGQRGVAEGPVSMSENSENSDEEDEDDNDGSSSSISEGEAEQDGPPASAEVDATAEASTGLPQVQERDDVNGDSSVVSDAEGSEEGDTSEEDDDEDDEEPTLRYSRIQSPALNERLFAKGQDTCSALAVSDKYLVLGTNNGAVCILARPEHRTGAQDGAAATPAGATPSQQKNGAVSMAAAANDVDEDAEGQVIVKRYRPHQAGVTEVVIDEESQFVGSASTDGKVVVLDVASSDAQMFDLKRPLRCLALEPSYASKSTRQFVSGGLSGNLTLHEKGWLGPKDVVLHSGEGPIWAVKWRRNYIAWANDRGVRVYDTHSGTKIAWIKSQDGAPRADLFPPTILWQSDTRIVLSQADFIKVVDLRDRRQLERERQEKERLKVEQEKAEKGSIRSDKTGSGSGLSVGHSSMNPLAGMGAYIPGIPGVSSSGGSAGATPQHGIFAEVTNVLQVDCMISGIVPFLSGNPDGSSHGHHGKPDASYENTTTFLVLSYTTEDTYSDEQQQEGQSTMRSVSQPPELRIISIATGEELSSDVLSVSGYEKFGCKDYRIVGPFPPPRPSTSSALSRPSSSAQSHSRASSHAQGSARKARRPSLSLQKSAESYFVISPMDLVLVKKRDVADHIAWLCERNRFEDALAVIERRGLSSTILGSQPDGRSGKGRSIDPDEIGQKFLQHLVDNEEWEKAARNLQKILQRDQKKWENWIFTFLQKGHFQTVIPYVPTHDPQLSSVIYEMILAHYLKTDPPTLLQTIKTWPLSIYDAQAVINAIRSTYEREASANKTSANLDTMMECLVELYLMNKQPGKAVPYYLRLRRPGVFDLIREYSLFTDVQDQALLLVEFDQDMRRRRERGKARAGVASHKEDETKHGEAIELLVSHTHAVPIVRVVAQLSSNRHYLYMYLDALFSSDPQAAFEYSDMLVDLYAEYDYARLLDFLRASTSYSLEKAYEICKTRDYVPEMVFLLGRMGNNKQALELIIERLGDVQRAIDFAKEQNDHDLWEDLLKYSETRPTFVRGLLENVGPEIDPIRLIRRIKNGLQIPGLKPALIKILQDFNIQISLIEGCKTILNTDCRRLTLELHDGQTNAFYGAADTALCLKCSKPAFLPREPSSSTPASATPAEALTLVFLCRHVFHITCALPDVELPSRPQHLLNPLLVGNDSSSIDKDRDITAKILFASQLKSRAKAQIRCPSCVAGRSRVQMSR